MVPDPTTLVVYGVPLVSVCAVLIALFRKHFPDSGDWDKWIAGVLAALSYLLITNLPVIEGLVPSIATWLPQALTVVLIFGATLGLIPGQTATKVKDKIKSFIFKG